MTIDKDGPARWVGNFPRKGWVLENTDELETKYEQACEFCGTYIRFIFYLFHPETGETRIAGCVCTEHLTEDYITPRRVQKEHKAQKRRTKRNLEKMMNPTWNLSAKGNWWVKHPVTRKPLTVFCRNHEWCWVHDGVFSPTKHPSEDSAMDEALDKIRQDIRRAT